MTAAQEDAERIEILVDALCRTREAGVSGARIAGTHRPPPLPTALEIRSWVRDRIDTASTVIVAWSRAGLRCPAVRADAERAFLAGTYLPVLLDDPGPLAPPAGLVLWSAPRLSRWLGAPDHPGWQRLLRFLTVRRAAHQGRGQGLPTVSGAR